MTISADQRRARILAEVRRHGSVRVVSLAQDLGLPAVTVRRDVAALADSGAVHRSHGSVSVPERRGASSVGGALGLLVPAVGQYFAEVIAGAREAAAERGVQLVLGISSYEVSADRDQVGKLLKAGVGGLLLAPNRLPSDLPDAQAWIGELPVPAVLVERRPAPDSPAAELDSVSSDHHHGMLTALRYLASLGRRHVALVARHDTWTAHQVRSGYTQGCALLGLTAESVIDGVGPQVDAEAVADQVVRLREHGTNAVVIHNDQDAIQLLPVLRSRGIRVPEDLSVISYDDVFAALGAPPLTAVAPPKKAVGAEAVELLLRRTAGGDAPTPPVRHVQLLPTLTVRDSCGGLAR
ncbi:substrate-binding domain-containing protein [Streptomyces sp. SID9124]|uniref:substrate-binding domain-containing protein n=1 Tax=Streptomyces sp. SID9124 TaxID=2706108 RepID=UPI0013E0E5DB|nr:substrate-binding domain-containing protein [Streptomyces sp. SID9124]NED13065.1 DeoR/GlpR family transcriptional regulator [Streptomyces sp. SID9124]